MRRAIFWCVAAMAAMLVAPSIASAKWIYGNGATDLEVLAPNEATFPGQVCDTRIQGRAGSEIPPPASYSPFTVRLYTGPAGSLDGSTVLSNDDLLTPDGTEVAPLTSVTTRTPLQLNPVETYTDFSGNTLTVYAAAPYDIVLPPGTIPPGNEIVVKQAGYGAIVTLAAIDCVTPPGVPRPQLIAGGALSNGTATAPVQVKETWTGTSGLQYNVVRSLSGGPYTAVVSATSATTLTKSAPIGSSPQFGVQSDDGSGTRSAFALGPRFAIEGHQQTEFSFSSGGWSTVSVSGAYGGSVARTTSLNATATLSFTGRDAGLMMTTGTAYGSVKVFVDGVLAGTVNNHTASGTKLRAIVFRKGFAGVGRHTIQIVNQATSGHPRADLDGLIVLH
jgi:hypothetical protein